MKIQQNHIQVGGKEKGNVRQKVHRPFVPPIAFLFFLYFPLNGCEKNSAWRFTRTHNTHGVHIEHWFLQQSTVV